MKLKCIQSMRPSALWCDKCEHQSRTVSVCRCSREEWGINTPLITEQWVSAETDWREQIDQCWSDHNHRDQSQISKINILYEYILNGVYCIMIPIEAGTITEEVLHIYMSASQLVWSHCKTLPCFFILLLLTQHWLFWGGLYYSTHPPKSSCHGVIDPLKHFLVPFCVCQLYEVRKKRKAASKGVVKSCRAGWKNWSQVQRGEETTSELYDLMKLTSERVTESPSRIWILQAEIRQEYGRSQAGVRQVFVRSQVGISNELVTK